MAKKISKHSRAARRGEHDVGGEARSLENLPRAENDDVRKQIIRTTIKNENLLAKKLEMNKIKKKGNKKNTNTLKHKTERSSKLEGILASKIQQSIDKARYVQTARKSGWDAINKNIVIRNDLVGENSIVGATTAEEKVAENVAEQQAEDDYVKSFFDNGDAKIDGEVEEPKPEVVKSVKPSKNIYDMLEETDC